MVFPDNLEMADSPNYILTFAVSWTWIMGLGQRNSQKASLIKTHKKILGSISIVLNLPKLLCQCLVLLITKIMFKQLSMEFKVFESLVYPTEILSATSSSCSQRPWAYLLLELPIFFTFFSVSLELKFLKANIISSSLYPRTQKYVLNYQNNNS